MRTLIEIAKDMGMQLTKGELTSVSSAVRNEYYMRYDQLPEKRTQEALCAGRPSRDTAYEYDTDADDWIITVIESVKDDAWWAAGRDQRRRAWHYANKPRRTIETDEVQQVLQEVAGDYAPKYDILTIRERVRQLLREQPPEEPVPVLPVKPRYLTRLEADSLAWLVNSDPADLARFYQSLQEQAQKWLREPDSRKYDAPLSNRQFECLIKHFEEKIVPSQEYEARLQEQQGEQISKILQPSEN